MNLWPPYLGAGVRIKRIGENFSTVEVKMKLRWWNRNYVKTHFGGSIYSMTDPFYMLILIRQLGREYIVWDKAASINFKKPGKSELSAFFRFSPDEIQEIKKRVDESGKLVFDRPVEVKDESGAVVAQVIKTLYVRKKT